MLVPQWRRKWTGSNGRWGGGWQQWYERDVEGGKEEEARMGMHESMRVYDHIYRIIKNYKFIKKIMNYNLLT